MAVLKSTNVNGNLTLYGSPVNLTPSSSDTNERGGLEAMGDKTLVNKILTDNKNSTLARLLKTASRNLMAVGGINNNLPGTGIHLDENNLSLWGNDSIKFYSRSAGLIARIDKDGRYLPYSFDSNPSGLSNIKCEMHGHNDEYFMDPSIIKTISGDTSIAWSSGNLTTYIYPSKMYAKLSNDMYVMVYTLRMKHYMGSTFINDGNCSMDDTWFRVYLPCRSRVFSAVVNPLCHVLNGVASKWFVNYNTVGLEGHDYIDLCCTEANKAAGFTLIVMAKETTESTTRYTPPSSGSGGYHGGGGGGGCFEAGTQILMADKTTKNIEDIKIGDQVLSYNVHEKKLITETIKFVMDYPQRDRLVKLAFSDGTVLETTETHPFYTTNGWVSLTPDYRYDNRFEDLEDQTVSMMEIGQTFLKTDGDKVIEVKLDNIEKKPIAEDGHRVYNLDIDKHNTFFTNGILGHNTKSFTYEHVLL